MNVCWNKFSKIFINAFEIGDIKTLEIMKEMNIFGFSNLDDLGEPFIKYGSGFYKWDEMIADANTNKLIFAANHPYEQFILLFTKLFNKGDVGMLENFYHIGLFGYRNLDDYGPLFIKYGPGLNKWDELIEDAKLNSKSWEKFITQFHQAFYSGDIVKLELLKNIGINEFTGIDDLGQPFTKYGSDFDKWSELINDAIKNRKN